MLTTLPLRHSLAATLLAAGLCLITSGSTFAGNCGCEPTCEICTSSPSVCCDCSGGCCGGRQSTATRIGSAVKKSCAFKALDAFAGGVEKLLGLDKCGGCDAIVCDDGCDAAIYDELMLPPGPVRSIPGTVLLPTVPTTINSAPVHLSPMESIPPQSAPSQEVHVAPLESEMRMTEPRVVDPQTPAPLQNNAQPLSDPEPSQVPIPESKTQQDEIRAPNTEPDDGGSLFDTLSNPFSDDDARVHMPQPVRPSSYESFQAEPSDYHMRPIRKRPLSKK